MENLLKKLLIAVSTPWDKKLVILMFNLLLNSVIRLLRWLITEPKCKSIWKIEWKLSRLIWPVWSERMSLLSWSLTQALCQLWQSTPHQRFKFWAQRRHCSEHWSKEQKLQNMVYYSTHLSSVEQMERTRAEFLDIWPINVPWLHVWITSLLMYLFLYSAY